MRLILLGPPASGKGTQAEFLKDFYSIPSISTGSIIRHEISSASEFGQKAKTFIDNGELVPDELVIEIVKQRLSQDDCKNGYILDGFPRTVAQAEFSETHGIGVDKVLLINVDDDEVVHRITGRRECTNCGAVYHTVNNPPETDGICDKCKSELYHREDDTEETVRKRLAVYHKQTEPLIKFYTERNLLVKVDGKDKVEDTTKAVFKALGEEYGNN